MKPSEALQANRNEVRSIVESHNARNPRVFGSAARGDDREESDLDILIDPSEMTTLFDIAAIKIELEKLLGVPIDVVTPRGLPECMLARVLAEARPI